MSDTCWWNLQVAAVFPFFIIKDGARPVNPNTKTACDDEISGD